jgi:uncharacterized protein YndB with AHSA1/START domain
MRMLAALFIALPLCAQVIDSADNGFTLRYSVAVQAAPEAVYRAAVSQIDRWWSEDHTFSGNAANLSIDGQANGCFCEKLPAGGSVRHLTVIYAEPGKMLRMTGGLGPLQALAVTGTMTWNFVKTTGGTRFELTYAVSGYSPGGMKGMGAPIFGVLKEQIDRLKDFIEAK